MSRPKRKILLVCLDQEKCGRMRFVLEVWGFAVTQAASAEDAAEVWGGSVDLVLMVAPLPDAMDVSAYVAARPEDIPMLAIGWGYSDSPAEACLPNPAPAEILQRVKLLVARKRGPKKKPAQSERAIASEVQNAK
jgi:two-component system response regulator CpxR